MSFAVAQEQNASIELGELKIEFKDNSESPAVLSGLQSLFNTKSSPGFDAFDPEGIGSSAGLNFEHIISGQQDANNKFTPRYGRYTLHRVDSNCVELRRMREDSPWSISSSLRYTFVPPHYVDFRFRCIPHDRSRFGKRNYAIFFFANYMNQVDQVGLNFRGKRSHSADEDWILGDAPNKHPDYIGGGTYRHFQAKALEYDDDHNFKLNVWSYEWPRFTKPFYFGRAGRGMTMMLMFNKTHSDWDEMRFSLFKFKVKDEVRKPAWDFQYVIRNVQEGHEYGFDGRMVWKQFVSADDCLGEYTAWAEQFSE